jgi:hypothetical protein
MTELPDEYIPKSLRPEKKKKQSVMYAVGYKELGRESYGMFDGPTPKLEEMLEVVPRESKPCYIFKYNSDGTEERIYQWQNDKWKKCVWR